MAEKLDVLAANNIDYLHIFGSYQSNICSNVFDHLRNIAFLFAHQMSLLLLHDDK